MSILVNEYAKVFTQGMAGETSNSRTKAAR